MELNITNAITFDKGYILECAQQLMYGQTYILNVTGANTVQRTYFPTKNTNVIIDTWLPDVITADPTCFTLTSVDLDLLDTITFDKGFILKFTQLLQTGTSYVLNITGANTIQRTYIPTKPTRVIIDTWLPDVITSEPTCFNFGSGSCVPLVCNIYMN